MQICQCCSKFSSIRYILVVIFSLISVYAVAQEIDKITPEIVTNLVDSLSLTNPVILDIRCGEWSSSLDKGIRYALLAKGVDLREANIALFNENTDNTTKDKDDYNPGKQ